VLLAVLKARVRACVSNAVAWAKRAIREALRPAPVAGGLLCDVFRSRGELLAENALLRQQLLVASRSKKRPAFRPYERGLVVFLSSIMPRWRDALLLVKPDTIIRWQSPSAAGTVADLLCLFGVFDKDPAPLLRIGAPPQNRLARFSAHLAPRTRLS
jgi:hypothetical protein